MKGIKRNKGITLVALVITIIVLLILAGVTIGMLTGENGILTKSKQARSTYEQKAGEENKVLNSYEDELTKYGTGNGEEGNLPNIEDTKPYLPDDKSTVIENSTLETGLVVKDKNNNEWVWIEVPKTKVFVTAKSNTDYEKIRC